MTTIVSIAIVALAFVAWMIWELKHPVEESPLACDYCGKELDMSGYVRDSIGLRYCDPNCANKGRLQADNSY